MDVTNRAVIIGGALLWIFLVFVVILLAWGAPEQSIDRLGDLAGYLEDHNTNASKLIITFGGLVLILLAAIVVILEVAPPSAGTVRIGRVGGGDAQIGTDEVVQRIEDDLRALPQLNDVQATVRSRGSKAGVDLDLYVRSEADLVTTSEEAIRRARELVEGRLGIALDAPPKARIHYRELQVRQREAPSTAAETPRATPAPMAGQETESVSPPPPPSFHQPAPASTGEPSHESKERPAEDRPAGA
jgi:hypothetical protein